MEMVNILKGRLPEGLEIIKIKDRSNRSQVEIIFRYQGVEVNGWLPKMCTPGYEENVCDRTAYNAILSVALYHKNNIELAQEMLDKIQNIGKE